MSNSLTLNKSTLNLPEGVDKLNTPQKVVAGGLIAGSGAVTLYYLLPPLVVIFTNLWIFLLLAAPLGFIIYNKHLVWGIAKTISWRLTQSLIGMDVLAAMDRYHDWLVERGETMKKVRDSLATNLRTTNSQISEKEKSYNTNLKKADIADKSGNTAQCSVFAGFAANDKNFIETLLPIVNDVQNRVTYMDSIIEAFDAKTSSLRYEIDTKKTQYESLRAMHTGMNAAHEFINPNGEAHKIFEESVKQLTHQMNHFTEQINRFDREIKPVLESTALDKKLLEEKGLTLLEEFRKTQF